MRYCLRCLYPENHPLGLVIDDAGICSGCRVHEEKAVLDWAQRLEELKRLARAYKSSSRHIHDCIVPVSGARDSWFIVHTVKHVLGLNPLLVTYNKQYNTQVGIRNLAYLRTLLGCDIVTQTLSPDLVKRVTRETLRLKGSMYWHCLAGQTVFPVHMAVKLKIPLIIWGAHQGLDQVGMFSHRDMVEMTRKYRKEHDLMGMEAEDLARASDSLSLEDLEPFVYPSDEELEAVGVRGIYLGNSIPWDSKAQHEAMIRLYGYETARQQRTFDTYNDVDCFHYSGLHDFIKYVKHGYGKALDHACREIRWGRLTREQGAALARRYAPVFPADLPLFAAWIGQTEQDILDALQEHRSPDAWRPLASGGWELLDSVSRHLDDAGVDAARLPLVGDCDFVLTPYRDPLVQAPPEDRYVLIGRGWVDGA